MERIQKPDFDEMSNRMLNKIIFDGRNHYNKEILKEIGFDIINRQWYLRKLNMAVNVTGHRFLHNLKMQILALSVSSRDIKPNIVNLF